MVDLVRLCLKRKKGESAVKVASHSGTCAGVCGVAATCEVRITGLSW